MLDHEARLDQAIRSFQEQANKATQLKERISELKGQARNADGSVTVVVAPSGAVLGLQLAPAAMRRTHVQLQQEILSVIRQATQQAAAAMQATVEPLLGDRAAQFTEAFTARAGEAIAPIGPTSPPPASNIPAPPQYQSPQPQQPQPRPVHRPEPPGFDDEEPRGPILR